jgi:MshEN domain
MSFQLRTTRAKDLAGDDLSASPAPEPVPGQPAFETPPSDPPGARLRPSLASLLADEGVATMDQLEEALAEGMKSGERLGEVVLRRGWINEAALAQLIARRWDLSFVARSMLAVDDHAQALLPRGDAERLGACPVAFNDGVPLVAIADPSDERFSAVRDALGSQCTFVVTTPSALTQLIAESPAGSAATDVVQEPVAAGPPVVVAPPEVQPAEVETPVAAVPEPEPEPENDAAPALEELDRLLARLVADRVQASNQIAGYRRQLDELDEQKARVEADLRALESKLGQEDQVLDSMRSKLGDLGRTLPEH